MTDNQAIDLREVLAASCENLKRTREILGASASLRRQMAQISQYWAPDVVRTPMPSPTETSLQAWQEFGAE